MSPFVKDPKYFPVPNEKVYKRPFIINSIHIITSRNFLMHGFIFIPPALFFII